MANEVCDLAVELATAFQDGKVDEDNIERFSYAHLAGILMLSKQMEDGVNLYKNIKSLVEQINIGRLSRQVKITVAIMADFSGTWIGDELIELLKASDRFVPYIVVLSNFNGQDDSSRLAEYSKTLEYFQKYGNIVLPSINPRTKMQYSWKELGITPDLCIWLNPWPKNTGDFYIINTSLKMLHTYIPYCLPTTENEQEDFIDSHFNQVSHLIMWKIFYDSRITCNMARNNCYLGDMTGVYTGYPKLDPFYYEYEDKNSIWQKAIKNNNGKNLKRIIWAPHHTIEEWEPIHFATFQKNYRFMLDMAKKFQDETVWIVRPHPLLKFKAIRAGIFADENEWDNYIAEWESLKNAMFYETGDYYDLMLNSDAMIMDCGSFIGEYMFSGKPMLFLDSGRSRFTEMAKGIMETQYKTDGDDFLGIEEFIKKQVIDGVDEKADSRKQYFEKNMDYRRDFDGKSAAQNIYSFLLTELSMA